MEIEIVEELPEILAEYEKVPISFEVETIFRVELLKDGLGGVKLMEEAVEKKFVKDYDEHEKPSQWIERFDLTNWGIISAFDGEKRIGGAAIAFKSPEIHLLEGRADLACLWDLRVAPEYRGKGFGNRLFENVLNWAKQRNCGLFKVETQNINVPACRFYVRQDCRLGAFNLHAYPEAMNEVQLVWYRKL
jgi:GNAT superfamily N-acetyltransferase